MPLGQSGDDLLVDAVESQRGDVFIEVVGGSLFDARGQTAAQVLDAEQIAQVWSRLSPLSIPLFRPRAATALHVTAPTDAQVQAYAAHLHAAVQAFFGNVALAANTELGLAAIPAPLPGLGALLGSDWSTQADFETFNPAFSFTASTAQATELVHLHPGCRLCRPGQFYLPGFGQLRPVKRGDGRDYRAAAPDGPVRADQRRVGPAVDGHAAGGDL